MITIQRAQELAQIAAHQFFLSDLRPSFDIAYLNVWYTPGRECRTSNVPNYDGPMTAPLNEDTIRTEKTLYRALLRSFENYEALAYTCECGEVREDHIPNDIIASQPCTKVDCPCLQFRSLADQD